MPFFNWFFVLPFVTWRVTSLLFDESPFDWLRKILKIDQSEEDSYKWAYPETSIAQTFSCFWCLSLWVSLLFSIILTITSDADIMQCVMLWLSGSAGAIVVERITRRSSARW